MKSILFLIVISACVQTSLVHAQLNTPVTAVKPGEPPIKFPKTKWFDGEKGFLEAKQIQEKTGADILMYFFSNSPKDEKGLCSWWEKYGLQDGKVMKLLDTYIKVKMEMPFNKKEEVTFAEFKFNKTPAVYVVKPTGYPSKISVFDWSGNQPKLKEGPELVDLILKASTPKTSPDGEAKP
jgi:hypothetical protein